MKTREEENARRREIYHANKERAKAWYTKSYHKNKDKILERHKLYRKDNPEKCKELNQNWIKDNIDHCRARSADYSASRRAIEKKATPKWANRFFIREIYDLARRRTECLGQEYQVDHIVPLHSNIVCGLHVEHNMQIIPKRINIQKGNRHWPDMPEEILHG